MLEAWRSIRIRAAEVGRQLLADARQSQACRTLMSIPGIGVITATSFVTAIEDPNNFKKSRSVAAWIGLTTRRYQSGEVDYDGHISRRGDRHLRGLLYEAAAVILTHCSTESSVRDPKTEFTNGLNDSNSGLALSNWICVEFRRPCWSTRLRRPTDWSTQDVRIGKPPRQQPYRARSVRGKII